MGLLNGRDERVSCAGCGCRYERSELRYFRGLTLCSICCNLASHDPTFITRVRRNQFYGALFGLVGAIGVAVYLWYSYRHP